MIYMAQSLFGMAILIIGLVALIALILKRVLKNSEKVKLENEAPKNESKTQQSSAENLIIPVSCNSLPARMDGEGPIGCISSEELSNESSSMQQEMSSTQNAGTKALSQDIGSHNDASCPTNAQSILQPIEARKKVEPRYRGGKYVGTENSSPASIRVPESMKCDEDGCFVSLVCVKKSIKWHLGAEIEPKEGSDYIVSVFQGTNELEMADDSDACYMLENVSSPLCISLKSTGAEKRQYCAIMPSFPMVFRIEDRNRAVHIASVSKGKYLVLVPDSWRVNDTLAGPSPVLPESTIFPHVTAHYFFLDESTSYSISFFDSQGKEINVRSKRRDRFMLEGNRLTFDRENGADYFSGCLPTVCYEDKTSTNMVPFVGTLVFGMNEGYPHQRARYSKKFSCNSVSSRYLSLQDFFDGLKGITPSLSSTGKYYVRIYDDEDALLESFAFYFIEKRFEIVIENEGILPEEAGHKPVIFRFSHDAAYNVNSDARLADISVIERTEETTVIKLHPSCGRERVLFSIGINDYSFELPLYVPKLWWAIQQKNGLNPIWQDRAVELARSNCSASSDTTVVLYWPEMLHNIEISIGFDTKNKKVYKGYKSKNSVEVHLRDFCDDPSLSNPGVHDLKLWIKKEQRYESVTLCRITIVLACSSCDFVSSTEEEIILHYREHHLFNDFLSLTYDELRKLQPDLPARIYQCSYCGHYVEETIEQHATTEICRHIDSCPKVDHDSLELPKKCFRVVTNPEEIKQDVIKNLSIHHKCRYCNEIIDNEDEFINHIITRHGKNKVYKMQ